MGKGADGGEVGWHLKPPTQAALDERITARKPARSGMYCQRHVTPSEL